MNKDFEKQYEKLNSTEATKHQLLELSFAIKELAEALSEHSVWSMFRHITLSQRYLSEFKGHFVETPKLTENEGNFAGALHTYMRKGMDCPLGTMLYRMISEDRGTPVWYAFVKGLVTNKRSYPLAYQAADHQYRLDETTDNLLMLNALAIWGDQNFPDALDWVNMGA